MRILALPMVALLTIHGSLAVAADLETVRFAASPGEPIVTYTREHGAIAHLDRTPLLRIYEDGLVRVHIPRFMRRAGDYEMRLTPIELERLLTSLTANGVTEFDPESTRQQRVQALARKRASGDSLVVMTDSTYTRIELRMQQSDQTGKINTDLHKVINWPDLAVDRERFPGIGSLQGLAAAEQALSELSERYELKRSTAAASGSSFEPR